MKVGVSIHLIEEYNSCETINIAYCFSILSEAFDFCKRGEYDKAKKLLPKEKVYPVSEEIMRRLGMD